jgi:hypothetical protein
MVSKLEITEENARLTMDHLYLDNHQIKTTNFTYFLQLAETWMVPAAAAAASLALAGEWPDSNKIDSFQKSVI